MSQKQAGEAETPFKEDYVSEMKKNAVLTAQIDTLKTEKERLQAQIRRLNKQMPVESSPKETDEPAPMTSAPQTTPAQAPEQHSHEPAKAAAHTDWFPPYCPDGNCDAKNIQWKDEAKCSTCGARLGKLEPIKTGKIGRCHNCGGTSYKPISSVEELGYRIA